MDNNQMVLRICIFLLLLGILVLGAITYSSLELAPSEFQQKLLFAAGVLTGLALLFAFSITVYVWGPSSAANGAEPPGKVVFDACVKIIPPIITLVLGYYFGATSVVSQKDVGEPKVTATSSVGSSSQSSPPSPVTQSK